MVDLAVFKGDSQDYVITVKNSSNVAIDIIGYTFYMTVKADIDDTDANAKIKKKVTSHTDPTNGRTIISLSSSDTDLEISSASSKYVYDIKMKDTTSKVTTLLHGAFKVKQPVLITPT